jgi:tRNA 5-methylaminomethyl-2-thiouridine biosynthesis bifunctional protein
VAESLRPARIAWAQNAPVATDFDDVYFSRDGGSEESRYVFLEQNALPERFSILSPNSNFTIVETGFGTGLNWLTTVALWRSSRAQGWLHFVSLEKFPLQSADLEKAHASWPQFEEISAKLRKQYPWLMPGFHRLVFPEWQTTLTLFFGDICNFLPRLSASADAWYLDGFAPQKNPEMWGDELYRTMAIHSRAGCTFATFTAAGHVRRGLVAAGFTVHKTVGFGSKREMLRGALAPKHVRHVSFRWETRQKPWLQRPKMNPTEKRVCVIGAGIAGATTAHSLAMRGWSVTVLEQAEPASGASGNLAAVVYPQLQPGALSTDNFQQQAWLHTIRTLKQGNPENSTWHRCGLLQLIGGNQAARARRNAAIEWPEGMVEHLDADAASVRAGVSIQNEALWYPDGGWIEPTAYCRQLLSTPGVSLRCGIRAERIEQTPAGWAVWGENQILLHDSPVLIIANACAALKFSQMEHLPLQPVRGQVALADASPHSKSLATIICHDGYVTPALATHQHCMGATFHPDDTDTTVQHGDQEEIRQQLHRFLPEFATSLNDIETWKARASIRCQSPDYLPLVGPLADYCSFMKNYAALENGKVMDYPDLPVLSGLYMNVAHGSKGFSQAGLAAEILAAELNDEPFPVSRMILDALHPMRFWIRQLKRRK